MELQAQDKEQQMDKGPHELTENQNGRYVFLSLAVCFTVLAIPLASNLARSQNFILGLPILICLLATIDLVACVYYCSVFERRSLHAFSSGLSAICDLVVLAFLSDSRSWIIIESVLLLILVCLHALVPTDSPAARLLLPWYGKLDTTSLESEDVEKQQLQQTNEPSKHTRQIRHRTLSVFHDWPAPIPFSARTLYKFKTDSSSELPFNKGDELTILDCRGNWWQARHPVSGQIGFVPSNFIAVRQKARVVSDVLSSGPDALTLQADQTIEVMEVHESACLCRSSDGKIGSVPSEHLELLPS